MTQAQAILDYMQRWHSITPMEALNSLDCMSLGARIYDLRNAGHLIRRELIIVQRRDGTTTRVAKYWLEGGAQ